ncbi:hypothetical protein FOL47_006064 [Perkinsus chesapeaki]|uniref:Uncharacterized protein n=1 Tax=Perkinsus chesapeaki TaxID=330153 RepID=A0A7J6LVB0_PERCH|nr:hypothetical protein FOL47_006064 [Perkinsus chesapeaki]
MKPINIFWLVVGMVFSKPSPPAGKYYKRVSGHLCAETEWLHRKPKEDLILTVVCNAARVSSAALSVDFSEPNTYKISAVSEKRYKLFRARVLKDCKDVFRMGLSDMAILQHSKPNKIVTRLDHHTIIVTQGNC